MSTSTRPRPVLPLLFSLALAASAAACTSTVESAAPATEPSPTEPAPEDPVVREPGAPFAMAPIRDGIDPAVVTALKKGSIDVAKLPANLGDLTKTPSKLKAVMESFTIALGTTCSGCHAGSGTKMDYEAETPKKLIAGKMWTELVGKLQRADGAPLYCDSCHQGKMKFLDRTEPEALGTWMEDNFVKKLARRDGQEHACTTCHGEPFKGDILAGWSR